MSRTPYTHLMKIPNYKQLILSAAMLALPLAHAQDATTLPAPDGKPAVMSKPMQVFVLGTSCS